MKRIYSIALGAVALISGCGEADNQTLPQQDVNVKERSAYYLTDNQGYSLYTFDKDTLNVSNCKGECLEIWPKFFAPDSTGGLFNVLPDDANHTALLKHPLYYFHNDTAAGETNGDFVNGVWHLVYTFSAFSTTTDVILSNETHVQKYITDEKGFSLYTFDLDDANVSNCIDQCIEIWPVFYSDTADIVVPSSLEKEDFGEITRSDGKKQTTYKSKPLYYFHTDTVAGDVKGDWVNGVWHLVGVKP